MDNKQLEEISKKLDIIITILLAKSGISQQEIAKMLGISNKTIQKFFGKNYQKLQDGKNE